MPCRLKKPAPAEIPALCSDIRQFLLDNLSETGGHLASNLGAVELTVALQLEYDTARDRVVFDVGHQCYVHKLLTSRRAGFAHLRQFDGMSGFPKPEESAHDAFIAGHASTSISAATGMARARTLLGGGYDVAAVVGDGALTGGMCYEALNDAGRSGEPMVVILNDNDMSISKAWARSRSTSLAYAPAPPSYSRVKQTVKNVFYKLPGGRGLVRWTHDLKQRFKYLLCRGRFSRTWASLYRPGGRHDVEGIRRLIRYAREQACPALIHVKTVKGKGYRFSQEHPDTFHGTSSFDMATGKPVTVSHTNFFRRFRRGASSPSPRRTRASARSRRQCRTAPAFRSSRAATRRVFLDVGIAEEHAVTMAAGMAKQG